MKIAMLSTLLVLGNAGNAFAGDPYQSSESGKTLLAKCVGAPELRLVCGGYTTGIYDLVNFLEADELMPHRHCFASGVSRGQILDVIVQYLQNHPEALHRGAGDLRMEALEKAWPCH
jgi:hypothetical protein